MAALKWYLLRTGSHLQLADFEAAGGDYIQGPQVVRPDAELAVGHPLHRGPNQLEARAQYALRL